MYHPLFGMEKICSVFLSRMFIIKKQQDAILDCGYLRPKEFLTLFTPFEGFNKISKHSKSHAPPSLSVYFQPVFTKNGGMPAQRSTCVCLGFECTTTNTPPHLIPCRDSFDRYRKPTKSKIKLNLPNTWS